MSFASPFAGSGSGAPAFAVPGQRRQDDSDVEVVRLTGAPSVDLLPRAVAEADRFRRLQVGLAAALGLVVVGAAAATVLAGARVSSAEEALAGEQARTAQLQAEQAQFAEVPLLEAQRTTLTTARDTALAQDVLWYRYSAHLANQLPDGMRLTSLSMQLADGAAAPVDPAATSTVGSVGGVTLSLEGRTVPDTADLLDVLGETPGVQGPWADSTTAGAEGGTTVQAHADLDAAALSGRYAEDATGADGAAVTGAAVPVADGTSTAGVG
ncbi:hypothetical protein [uncultured Pseudokineococcus sp.]|uniref:hypothetical protein n=1 Tax=uncultured Pseudokineococcus sp. TaxID=1642928 RepID=UPI00260D62BA|nr:hypothetical protein [uncultured Pseudokineococcus sp.]